MVGLKASEKEETINCQTLDLKDVWADYTPVFEGLCAAASAPTGVLF